MGLHNHPFPPSIAATRAGELDYLLLRVISKLSPCSEGTLLKRINGETTSVRHCLARLVSLGLIELKNQKVIITDTGRGYVSPKASHKLTSDLPYNGSIIEQDQDRLIEVPRWLERIIHWVLKVGKQVRAIGRSEFSRAGSDRMILLRWVVTPLITISCVIFAGLYMGMRSELSAVTSQLAALEARPNPVAQTSPVVPKELADLRKEVAQMRSSLEEVAQIRSNLEELAKAVSVVQAKMDEVPGLIPPLPSRKPEMATTVMRSEKDGTAGERRRRPSQKQRNIAPVTGFQPNW